MVPACRVFDPRIAILSTRSIALTLLLLACVGSTAVAYGEVLEIPIAYDAGELSIIEGPDGVEYRMPGLRPFTATGAPQLLFEQIRLVLPHGSGVARASLVESEWSALGRPGSIRRVPLHTSSDGEVAASDDMAGLLAQWDEGTAPFPAEPYRVGQNGIAHGFYLGLLELYPLKLSADGELSLLTRGVLRVELEPRAVVDSAVRAVDWPGRFEADLAQLRRIVRNPQDLKRFAPARGRSPELSSSGKAPNPDQGSEVFAGGNIEYVIITTTALAGEFQRLADAHTAHGLPARVVTVDWIAANYPAGVDIQETIRFFLKRAYSDWGLRFALLGGDSGILPPRYARSYYYPEVGYTDVPCDLYYGGLDGNWNDDGDGLFGEAYMSFLDRGDEQDMLAEIYVGRAPVNDLGEAALFVDKCLRYQDPADGSHLGRALFLSEVLFPDDWNGIEPIQLDGAAYSEDIIFDSIITPGNQMESYRFYENYSPYFGAEPETVQAAMDSMNSGRFGLVNHVGHGFYYNMSVGDGNIFVFDANTLTNSPGEFVIYALNCSSGAFDYNCLLESMIQNPNGGAVAAIGSCRAAFPTAANNYQQVFYDEIFVQWNDRIGEAMDASRSAYTPSFNSEGVDRWTHFTYTLLGDPAQRMWRRPPQSASVTASAITLGDEQATIDVSASGQPIQNARVTLHKQGEAYATGLTDAAGQAVLDFRPLYEGVAQLVVSGMSLRPHLANLVVGPAPSAHIAASVDAIDDGGGDGVAEAGETVSLTFQFDNNGDGSMAGALTATLSAVDAPGATISDPSIAVGDLFGGQSVTPADPVVIDLDPAIVDGSTLIFQLESASGGETWRQRVELRILAPEPKVTRVVVDDSSTGNGNGTIEAGEEVELWVEVTNYGAGALRGLTGSLSTGSPNVTLVDTGNAWSEIALKGRSFGAGTFSVIESDVGVENLILLTLTDDMGRSLDHSMELRPPSTASDPLTNTSLGPSNIALLWDASTDPHVSGYRVYRSLSGSGPFAEITVDATMGSGYYMDDGLDQLTRYYYQVATVDSTGLEGPPSGIVSASTAPPEQAGGFPLPVKDGVSGAAAVGDLLGDGSLVVAAGSDLVYVLDSNGEEILDGDNDSQTLGPISAAGQKFTPSGVTMADLDGIPGLEILASSWDTNEIYAFRADGSFVPGWPQTLNNRAWANPSVADIDNDGDPEVVVNNVGGRTYAWHHDGTEFLDGDSNPGSHGVFQIRTGENFNRSTIALHDVDGDGTRELIFGTNYRNGSDNVIHALRNDGTDAPGWPVNLGPDGYNVTSITVADLDQDGMVEIIYPCEDDNLYIFSADGSPFPGFPIFLKNKGGDLDSKCPSVAVGQFDSDPELEMVAVSIAFATQSFVNLLDHDGALKPGWPQELPGLSEGSPIIGDLNGDFSPDIVFGIGGGADGYPNLLAAYNSDGTPVEGFPISMGGPVRGTPTICDFDFDGDVDVVLVGFDRLIHVWDMPFDYHPSRNFWPTWQANSARTGVYGELHPVAAEPELPASRRTETVLHPATPNPFNPSTLIRFELPAGAAVDVRIDVFDLSGRRVRALLSRNLPAGNHEVRWDGKDDAGSAVASGIYFARLSAGEQVHTIKMALAK